MERSDIDRARVVRGMDFLLYAGLIKEEALSKGNTLTADPDI